MIWALAQTEKVREIAEWPAGECRCRPRPNNLRKCGGKCSGGCSANVRKMVGTSSAAWWARGGGEHVREMLGECSENIRKFKEHAPKYRGPGAFARLLPYPDSPRPLTEIDWQSKPFTTSPEVAEAARPHPTARSPNTSQRAPYGPNVSNVPILFRTFARPSFKITPLPKSPPPGRSHPRVGGEARGRLQTSVRSSASENPMAALRKMPLPLPAPRRTTRSPELTCNRPPVKSPARSENKPQSNFQSHFPPHPPRSIGLRS